MQVFSSQTQTLAQPHERCHPGALSLIPDGSGFWPTLYLCPSTLGTRDFSGFPEIRTASNS